MFRFFITLVLGVAFSCFSLPVLSQDVKTYIPVNAYQYLPILPKEVNRIFPTGPDAAYYAALAEQESCITLKHKRCGSPSSQLKTSREEGAGLFQLTRAYRKDGTVRFDKLEEMRDNYESELKEISWKNVYTRPDLQVRAAILLIKENWKRFFMVKDEYGKRGFVDSSYNGGPRDVEKGRLICGLQKGCNPDLWFGNVEKTIPKSDIPIYGTRSAKDINLEHVYNVLKLRYPKYNQYYTSQGEK